MQEIRQNCRVLVVDDQTLVVEKLRLILEEHADIAFAAVTIAQKAVEAAKAFKPTVILQDMRMPGIDGLELLARYREEAELLTVPVIILSGRDDPNIKEQSFSQGASDYIVKLPDRIELLARIRSHSAAYVARRDRDEAFHLLMVSQQQLAAANVLLQKLSGLDALSGVGNRRKFDETISTEWGRGLRNQTALSLIMCDIDHFKQYNDSFGHVSGDFCIKRTAAVLTEQLRRPADSLARYGGEEFAIILPETSLEGALLVAESCRAHIEQSHQSLHDLVSGSPITMSFGAATIIPSNDSSLEGLIKAADDALFDAKRGGRNIVRPGST